MKKILLTSTVLLSLTAVSVFGQTKTKNFNAGGFEFQASTVDDKINEAFCSIGEMPAYPGGYDSLATFLRRHIKYPPTALKDTLQGKVMIKFTVDTIGKVINAIVFKSVRADLDSVCLSAVTQMPKWTVGRLDGEPVAVYFLLPIKFTLTDSKK